VTPVRTGIQATMMEWRSPSSHRPKKSRLQKSKVKTILIAYLDSDGIIHNELVPAGQTVNFAFYEKILKRLLRRIHRVRPELHRTGQWMLLHDNAPAHCAIRVSRSRLATQWLLTGRLVCGNVLELFAVTHIRS